MNLSRISQWGLSALLGLLPLLAQQPVPANIARQPATATVQGLILTPANDRIPVVTVAAVRVFPFGQPDPIKYAVANDHGIYSIEGLSSGSYNICVGPGGTAWLDPCSWSEDPPLVNLTAGQVARKDVALEQGVWLYVQVEDEDGVVAQKEVQGAGPAYSVSVTTTAGHPANLQQVSNNAKSRSFRIAVPRGKNVPLSVGGAGLTVRGSDGKTVDPSAQAKPVNLATTAQTITFKVSKSTTPQDTAK